jgi:hypothetical protein
MLFDSCATNPLMLHILQWLVVSIHLVELICTKNEASLSSSSGSSSAVAMSRARMMNQLYAGNFETAGNLAGKLRERRARNGRSTDASF